MSPQSTRVRSVGRRLRKAASARRLFLAAAAGASAIGAAAATALVLGHLTLAVALAGWASTVLLLGAVAVLAHRVRAVSSLRTLDKLKGLDKQSDRIEATQRRILAAIEQERLDNAQRHYALLAGDGPMGTSRAAAARR